MRIEDARLYRPHHRPSLAWYVYVYVHYRHCLCGNTGGTPTKCAPCMLFQKKNKNIYNINVFFHLLHWARYYIYKCGFCSYDMHIPFCENECEFIKYIVYVVCPSLCFPTHTHARRHKNRREKIRTPFQVLVLIFVFVLFCFIYIISISISMLTVTR